jgi:hypothetical protein
MEASVPRKLRGGIPFIAKSDFRGELEKALYEPLLPIEKKTNCREF